LKILYDYVETTYKAFPLACKPGCSLCCTQKIFATSIEAYYILDILSEKDFKKLFQIEGYLRPKLTHNQILLSYKEGAEPSMEEIPESLNPCPFLTKEKLCKIYERRPLMCRITASTIPCEKGLAELPPFLFQISTIVLQLVENIDLGGLYGNILDLLKFLDQYKKGLEEEIPDYLLNTVDVDELPILPEEKELKKWVGNLYRIPVKEKFTFRDLLQKLRSAFKKYESLSFLKEIF